MRFEHDLGHGCALALRTPETARELIPVITANIDRLRRWEPWAHAFDSDDGDPDDSWEREQLRLFTEGLAIPAVIRQDGAAVGAVSARIDRYRGTAELGYWIDAAHEGRGIVRRACRALIARLFVDGIARIEIRTAAHNERSVRLADRLGFHREGTLRRMLPVGGARHDVAVFGLLPDDPA